MASRRLSDLAEPVRVRAIAMQKRCNLEGLNILIYRTLVSNEEQNELYKTGRGVVTNAKAGQSRHNPDINGKAWAFDAAPLIHGVIQWNDVKAFVRMGEIAESVGLEWSGRWTGKFREIGHFQMNKNKLIDAETMEKARVQVSPVGFAVERMKEPSTWAGLALLLQAAGYFFPQYAALINVASGFIASFAVVKPEV